MTKQIESTVCANRARVFLAISDCFENLPSRFKAGELEVACGFKKTPQHRMLVASVLSSTFKCRQVGIGTKQCWVKP